MPSYSKSTEEIFRKRLRELYEKLTAALPDEMREIRMIEGYLNAVGLESTKAYSNFTSPWDAIDLCLNLRGEGKLTKAGMAEEIASGGYLASKPKTARNLIKDSINYHIRKGILVVKDGKVWRG